MPLTQKGHIDFVCHDLDDLASLELNYDFCYGKWVLYFLKNPLECMRVIYSQLNAGGTFIYESILFSEQGPFSYPKNALLDEWNHFMLDSFKGLGVPMDFALTLKSQFVSLGFKRINLKTQQAMLNSQEEKSLFRLVLMSLKDSLIKGGVSIQKIEGMLSAFEKMEQDDQIIMGFVRDLMIRGCKP